MNPFFILLAFAYASLFSFSTANGQGIDTLIFSGIEIIPNNSTFENEPIEELSGIEYTGVANNYYLIPQSRSKTHIFLCSITLERTGIKIEFDSILYLNHGPLEAESIRVNPADSLLYIAEEGNGKSYIYRVDKNLNLKTIYTSTKEQRYNRGYEGLCFNPEGTIMYMGLERPKQGNMTSIITYNLENRIEVVYAYALDILPLDDRKDNGITELLTLNDSTLIVVERAFLGPKNGNSIRVYKARIPKDGNEIKKIKLLTTFSASPVIDNIEGVCFSASGKELLFISDNNGNKHQQNLFISMKIE